MSIEDNKKTIFITSFFNLAVRNVLETQVLKIIKNTKNTRVVLLVPEKNRDWFREKLEYKDVLIEGVEFIKPSRINLLLHLVSWNLLHTHSKIIHKRVQLDKDGKRIFYWLTVFLWWLGKWNIVRKVFRWLDYHSPSGSRFSLLFEKYNPAVVLATDIQDLRVQELSDTALVREARKRGVPSFAMSRSWDSITTKGLLRTLPDVLVVQTEDIKKQAVRYHSVDPEKILVTGFPHYDAYLNEPRMPRGQFFEKFGFDPAKKLVFLIVPSDIWTGDKKFTPYLLDSLSKLGEQVLVRLPIFGPAEIEGYTPPPQIVVDAPRSSTKLEDAILMKEDDDHLADCLANSDVVITGPSSIILDSAIFNKPTVLIGFDGNQKNPPLQSLRRYYDYDHQKIMIDRGQFKIADSAEEMVELTKEYLKTPEIGESGRRAVAESVCDGRAGEKLANAILAVKKAAGD